MSKNYIKKELSLTKKYCGITIKKHNGKPYDNYNIIDFARL